jgi:hypothetical protein
MPTQPSNLLLLSIQDFFTKPILKLAFYPFLLTMIILYLLFFVAADFGLDQMQNMQVQIEQSQTTIENGVPHTQTVEVSGTGSGVIDVLLRYSLTSWLAGFLLYTVGSFFVLLLSIVIALAIIGFLTPPILRIIGKRHYPDIALVGHGHLGSFVWHFIKSFIIMVGLFFILIPLYFVPIVNVIALNLPFYYFFHKLLVFDVATTITTQEEYALIYTKHAAEIRWKTLFLYLVSLIPFAIMFLTVFFVIYLGHTFFYRVTPLRKATLGSIEA